MRAGGEIVPDGSATVTIVPSIWSRAAAPAQAASLSRCVAGDRALRSAMVRRAWAHSLTIRYSKVLPQSGHSPVAEALPRPRG